MRRTQNLINIVLGPVLALTLYNCASTPQKASDSLTRFYRTGAITSIVPGEDKKEKRVVEGQLIEYGPGCDLEETLITVGSKDNHKAYHVRSGDCKKESKGKEVIFEYRDFTSDPVKGPEIAVYALPATKDCEVVRYERNKAGQLVAIDSKVVKCSGIILKSSMAELPEDLRFE